MTNDKNIEKKWKSQEWGQSVVPQHGFDWRLFTIIKNISVFYLPSQNKSCSIPLPESLNSAWL